MKRRIFLYTLFLLCISLLLIGSYKWSMRSKWHIESSDPSGSFFHMKHLGQRGVVMWGEMMTYGDEKITNYVSIDTILIERGDYGRFLSGIPNKMSAMYIDDMVSLGRLDLDSFVTEAERWFMSDPSGDAVPLSLRDENIGYLLADIFHDEELVDLMYAKELFSFTNKNYVAVRSVKSFMSCGQDTYFSYDVYRGNSFLARVRVYRCLKQLLTEQEILDMETFVWNSLAEAFRYSLKVDVESQKISVEE